MDHLETEKAFIEEALNAQKDIFLIFELESGRALKWNMRFNQISGYTDEEISLLKVPDSYCDPLDLAKTYQFIQKILKNKTVGTLDIYLVTKSGKKIPMEYTLSLVKNLQENSKDIIMVGRDISQRLMAQQKKNILQLENAQKMESLGTLSAGIAHDFNNILSGILGYSQLTEINCNNPQKTKKYAFQIIQSSKRAADLVKQILMVSKQMDHQKFPLNVSVILKEVLKLIRASTPATIKIRGNIKSSSTIMANPTQIYQLIMNLCTNANHAMMDNGGVLSVELKEIHIHENGNPTEDSILPGDYLFLRVSDTGHGMDKNTMERAFDPYFTTKETNVGTGLGLSIVQKIVEESNGYIRGYSSLGKGTTFIIYFPIVENNSNFYSTSFQKMQPHKGLETIMVVDDEKNIRSTIKDFLGNYRYEISIFPNGAKAYEAYEKDPYRFDLIITDLTMPIMSGEKFLLKVLELRKDLPIILCTGYNEKISETKAVKMGISKYIQKPIDLKELAFWVRKLLDDLATDRT